MTVYTVMLTSGLMTAIGATMSLDGTLTLLGLGGVFAGLSLVALRLARRIWPDFAVAHRRLIVLGAALLSAGGLALGLTSGLSESASFALLGMLLAAGVLSLPGDALT